jgi:multiple sugar transport system ATP-binding protein
MAGLRIRNLKKSFGSSTVIDKISVDVSDGEFCILLGPSGCGKTTILRLIAGLEQQDHGEIFIDSREVSNFTPKERNIAMVFQSYALYPHLTVYENMAFSLRMQKTPKGEIEGKVTQAAELLDIKTLLERKPKELSGGQRQRVAIGRAIVRNPSLFLFDEPLSNLDAKLRAAMRFELAKLHQQLECTIVYVTHDQTEAMTLGQKIILLNDGVIQQIGTPQELYDSPANLFVAGFIGTPQMNFIDGSVSFSEDRVFVQSGVLIVDVSHITVLKDYKDKKVVMGIRPESLIPGEGPIRGIVEVVEHLGSENILYIKAGEARFSVRALSDYRPSIGEEVSFILRDEGLHFFSNSQRIITGHTV